jgi:hypothetical protein
MSLWICREGARTMAPNMKPKVGVRIFQPVDRRAPRAGEPSDLHDE